MRHRRRKNPDTKLLLLGIGAFIAYKLFAGKPAAASTMPGSVAQEGEAGFVGPVEDGKMAGEGPSYSFDVSGVGQFKY
jgi:hypothetical protein